MGKNGLGVNVCTTRVFFSEFVVKYRPHFNLNIFSFYFKLNYFTLSVGPFYGRKPFFEGFYFDFFFYQKFPSAAAAECDGSDIGKMCAVFRL